MEPTGLNSPAPDESRLEAWLREKNPPLADRGFSAQVLSALPPAPRRAGAWRGWSCTVGALAGIAVAWPRAGSWTGVVQESARWTDAAKSVGSALVDPTTTLALVVAGLSLIVVFWRWNRLAG